MTAGRREGGREGGGEGRECLLYPSVFIELPTICCWWHGRTPAAAAAAAAVARAAAGGVSIAGCSGGIGGAAAAAAAAVAATGDGAGVMVGVWWKRAEPVQGLRRGRRSEERDVRRSPRLGGRHREW